MAKYALPVIAFFLLISFWGCGRKTLPIPPQAAIPAPISDLLISQNENKIMLSWTVPERTTQEMKLQHIDSFQIHRAVIPTEDYCSGCPVHFTSLIELARDEALKNPKQKKASYSETLLRPGHSYIYKVTTKAGWRSVSNDSNIVAIAWDSPPQAPENATITPGDRELHLAWKAPKSLIDGRPAPSAQLTYRINRSTDAETFFPVRDPVTSTTFVDSGLANGVTYYYRIQALLKRDDTLIAGLPSRTMSASPKDLTPPAPPQDVDAIFVDGRVRIMWSRAPDQDVAGYIVYRRKAAEHLAREVARTPEAQLNYLDTDLPTDGADLYYSITSIDRASPPNESIHSKEALAEISP